jgi:Flp pilus assembly protein TadD
MTAVVIIAAAGLGLKAYFSHLKPAQLRSDSSQLAQPVELPPKAKIQNFSHLDQAGAPLGSLDRAGPIGLVDPLAPVNPLSESQFLDKGATSPLGLSDLPPLPASLTDPSSTGEPAPMLGPLASPTIAAALVDRELASIPVPSDFKDVRPSPAKNLLDRGAYLLSIGKWDEAIAVFYKVLEIDPVSAQAYESLGQCYLNKNDLSKAVANLDSALRLNSNSVAAYVARATANIKLRYFERAHDDLAAALKLHPESIAALNWRSIAYINEGRPREARSDCNALLKMNPNVLDAYMVRCLANLQLGDPNGARSDYRAVVERSGNRDTAKLLEGWFEAFGQKTTLPPTP